MQEKIYDIYDKKGKLIYKEKTRAELLTLLGRDIQIGDRYQNERIGNKYTLTISRTTERLNTLSDRLLADFEQACRPFRKVDWEKSGTITLVQQGNEGRERRVC